MPEVDVPGDIEGPAIRDVQPEPRGRLIDQLTVPITQLQLLMRVVSLNLTDVARLKA